MSKTLKMSNELALPIEAVTEKLAFLGRTGSGKTYAAMKLAELMLEAGVQIGVLDPVGVWRALRVPATKGGAAFEVVVFGGLYGDVPMLPTAGELIADVVVDRGISFVLDVSQWIPAEQQTFVQAFGARFFQRKKTTPTAVHLFLEECQEFIPENPSGREALTLGVMQRLWKLGRNYGVGGSLISQRPQEIAKKALNMSSSLFAFQMTGPHERKAVRQWVADAGIAADVEGVLQKLKRGEPHLELHIEKRDRTVVEYSGVIRVLPRVTADLSSGATVGGDASVKRPLTPIDVEKIKTAMAETVERAKADDPRELRKQLVDKDKRINDLERVTSGFSHSNEKAKPAQPALTAADRDLVSRLVDTIVERTSKASAAIQTAEAKCASVVQSAVGDYMNTVRSVGMDAGADLEKALDRAGVKKVLEKLGRLSEIPNVIRANPTASMSIHPQNVPPATRRALEQVGRQVANGHLTKSTRSTAPLNFGVGQSGNSGLKAMHRAMLTALAQHPAGLTKKQILIHTGYASSGPVSTAFAELNQLGAVNPAGAGLRITDTGLQLLGDYDPLPIGDALREQLLTSGKLSTMEASLLRAVCAAYPSAIRKGEVLEQTNYASSGPVSSAFAKLVGLNYVRSQGPSMLVASEDLFS